MNEVIEALLVAWGEEQGSPALNVSIRSPLGSMDEEGARGVAGSRCLLTSVECNAALSPASSLVEQALIELAADEPAGLGSLGRVLRGLAVVRYARQPRLQVREQCAALGISQRTYRSRVSDLHLALEDQLPRLMRRRQVAEAALPSSQAAKKRLEHARLAAKAQARSKRERESGLRAFARAVKRAAHSHE